MTDKKKYSSVMVKKFKNGKDYFKIEVIFKIYQKTKSCKK